VRALLDAGHQDGLGQAFWYAACGGYTEIAQLLLEKDAKKLEPIYLTDKYNVLHCAVERGHLDTVALLLRYGAAPDKTALDLRLSEC
jgi:ankyrin repeat protein